MKHDEFVNQVQDRARLASRRDAERLIRIVFETLGSRIQKEEAKNLASQLPLELGRYLTEPQVLEKFGLDEFVKRVAKEEEIGRPTSLNLTKAVIDVLREAVSPGTMDDVISQLPQDLKPLFEGKPVELSGDIGRPRVASQAASTQMGRGSEEGRGRSKR